MAKKFLTGIDMDGNKITNIPSPTQEGDVANYEFVLSQVEQAKQGLSQSIANLMSNSDPSAIDSFSEVVEAFQQADTQISATLNTLYSIEVANSGRITALESNIISLNGTSGTSGVSGTSGLSGTSGTNGTSGGGGGPLSPSSITDTFQVQITSEGNTISDGFKGFRYLDSDITVDRVNLFSSATASVGFTVKIGDSVIGAIALANQKSVSDDVLANWTVSLTKGDYLEFHVDPPGGTSAKSPVTIVLTIEVTKINLT